MTRPYLLIVSPQYTLTNQLRAEAQRNGFGFGLFGSDDVARPPATTRMGPKSSSGRAEAARLTPRECARLMGFDAPGGSSFKIHVSDTQAYRQFGNSVVVPAVTAVAKLWRYFCGCEQAQSIQGELPLRA